MEKLLSFGLTKPTYTTRETEHILNIGHTKLYQLINNKKLKATKLGKKTIFLASDLAEFLSSLPLIQNEGDYAA